VAAKRDELVEEADFVISRVLAAPRALVFAAWTDARHLMQWWGPRGFTNRCQVDARPGGAYRIVMRSPDGVEYPMKGVYREVVAPERLVYTVDLSEHPETWHDQIDPGRDRTQARPALECVTSVTFVEEAGKTKLTVRMRFASPAVRDAFLKNGMEAGWTESFVRLDSSLLPTEERAIVATRLFKAPRELVWRMWTEPEHIARWWGPRGFTCTVREMDVRPGGVWRFVMQGPDGTDYTSEIIYGEVVKPERLSYWHSGDRCPAFVTVTFAVDGDQTRVSTRSLFASAAERERLVKAGAVAGWAETLDRLGEILAQ
jgi:uncharacterized protein YndB with AHSA1/START domain